MQQSTQTFPGFAKAIATRDHGASEIARRCLDILVDCARVSHARNADELVREMMIIAETLREARPSMTPVRLLIGRWMQAIEAAPRHHTDAAREFLVRQADVLKLQSLEAGRQIVDRIRDVIRPGQTILTHSISSVLTSIFEALRGRGLKVVLTESRPRCESLKLAEQLADWGYDTTLITDAQAGIFASKVDCVLVGAESVMADHAIINKAGTYLIALAAREALVPFYVACESYKFERRAQMKAQLEEGPADELGAPDIPNLKARNIYFDRTPARFVTAWITEQGIIRRADLESDAELRTIA